MVTLCIECKKIANKRQEALLYDGCSKLQHRTCSSGVSRDMYRNAVKFGDDIAWRMMQTSLNLAQLNLFVYKQLMLRDFPFDHNFTKNV